MVLGPLVIADSKGKKKGAILLYRVKLRHEPAGPSKEFKKQCRLNPLDLQPSQQKEMGNRHKVIDPRLNKQTLTVASCRTLILNYTLY